MSKKRYYYYVLVYRGGSPRFVTKVDNFNKVAEWNSNEKPLEMTYEVAKDLCLGLCMNLILCGVITSLVPLDEQMNNE